jgi:hypothetical protein
LAPLQSFTRTAPQTRDPAHARTTPLPLPRFFAPLTSSQPRGATLSRRFPSRPVLLRPQGFAPSRRLAPRATCRASFIPIPPVGFSLRGFDPRPMSYALSDAAALMGFLPCPRELGPPLQGLCTSHEALAQARGLTGELPKVPPWDFSSPGSLASRGGASHQRDPPSPPALSRLSGKLTSPPAPQGLFRKKRSRSLSRPAQPS